MPAAPAARADDPVTLSRDGQITDKVGALGDRRGQVVAALDRLYADRRIQLFVVYVRDFSGRSAQNWADETADKNGLGLDDVLLAVATHDRQYAYTVDPGSRLTDAQLRDVASTAIEPALKQNDWAGAAIGAANGYAAVVAGKPVPTPAVTPGIDDPGTGSSGGTSTGDLILPVVLVGGAGAVAAYAYTRRRRRTTTRTTPGATGWGQGAAPSGGPPRPPTPLPDLDAHAKQALVETDDAVRTSEEELGFATAQFGEEAAAPFTEAVTYAKGELTAAFRLRQQLDDAFPEDDATRRRMLDEIINRCTGANARLDAVSEDFDRLRALERNAPQALATAETAFRALAGRVSAAETTLTSMRGRYADSASSSVAGDIEQAKDRLVFTTSNLNQARQAVDGGNNAAAAVYVRAAEGAVDQATTLVDAVDRRARELAEAAAELPAALTETETDLADAGGLLEGTSEGVSTADLRGRIARAQSVLGDVNRELQAGRYDPIDALRRVEEADAALDEALAGAREREQGDRRARSLLDQAMLTTRSAIAAAADYITTNRGAVGSQARTRLAEAQRRLERARELAGTDDPQGALAEAHQADSLAGQARSLAEEDVRAYGNRNGPGGVQGGGGGVGGAVLGGIILGGLLGGGGGGRGYGGGFGGGFGEADSVEAAAPAASAAGALAADGAAAAASEPSAEHARGAFPRSVPAFVVSIQRRGAMTKQTILGRVTQLAKANINALLDQAEDPQKMLDQLIRDYTANISEAEQAVAATIGNLRLMEQDHREDVDAAKEWGDKALAASRKADELRAAGSVAEADKFDNLAKVALGRQLQSEKEAKTAEPTIASQTVVVDKLKSGLEQMKSKLTELKSKRDELVARAKSAQAQNQMMDSVKNINVLDPTSELSRFEDKVRREEAKAMGKQELAASSLDAQFEQLDSLGDSAEVEARLAALKTAS